MPRKRSHVSPSSGLGMRTVKLSPQTGVRTVENSAQAGRQKRRLEAPSDLSGLQRADTKRHCNDVIRNFQSSWDQRLQRKASFPNLDASLV